MRWQSHTLMYCSMSLVSVANTGFRYILSSSRPVKNATLDFYNLVKFLHCTVPMTKQEDVPQRMYDKN